MKKSIVTFVISALIVASLILWALKGRIAGNTQEIVMAGIVLVLVGFAGYLVVSRLRSHLRREPGEDELSRMVMTRASSWPTTFPFICGYSSCTSATRPRSPRIAWSEPGSWAWLSSSFSVGWA